MARSWDAFLSYSRGESGALAKALERGIEQFARPWNRLRACNVFRDDSSMSANPELWGTIEAALRDADHLILLASPAAATSKWVDREVGWWVDNKDPAGILLVAAEGTLAWDTTTNTFTRESAIPPSLRTAYREEPRWADATWFGTGATDPTTEPRFQDLVADLASPIRGIPRDELFGDDVAQHRKVRRLTRGAIAALSILLLAAVAAAVVAAIQRNEVVRQAGEIARQATSIGARQLSALASGLLPTDLRRGSLLAAEGLNLEDSPLARTVLLEATLSSPNLDHFVTFPSDITAVAPSAGSTIAVGTQDGRVYAVGTAADDTPVQRLDLDEPVASVAVSASGDVVVARGESAVGVAEGTNDPVYLTMPANSDLWGLAVSPDGGTWVLSATTYLIGSEPSSEIQVFTTGAAEPDAAIEDPLFHPGGDFQHSTQQMAFVDDTTVRLMSLSSEWTTLDLTDRTSPESWAVPWFPWTDLFNSSAALDVVIRTAQSNASRVDIWPTATAPDEEAPMSAGVALAAPAWLTASPDHSNLLAADSTGVYLVPVEDAAGTDESGRVARLLSGVADVTAGTFLADSQTFVLAADEALSVWHVESLGRAVDPSPIRPLDECSYQPYFDDCRASVVGVSPDGERMFTFDLTTWTLSVLPVPGSSASLSPVTWTVPQQHDGPSVAAWLSGIPPALFVWRDDGTLLTIWPGQPPDASAMPAGVLASGLGLADEPDGVDVLDARAGEDDRVSVATSDGRILVLDGATGELVESIALDPPDGEWGYVSARFAADGRALVLTDRGEYDMETTSSGPDALRVFDVPGRRLIAEFDVPAGMHLIDAAIIDGQLVVAFDGGPIWLIDDSGAGETRTVSSTAANILGAQQSAQLVDRGDGIVGIPTANGLELVDVAEGVRVNHILLPYGYEGAVRTYAFEPDGGALITTLYGTEPDTAIATRLVLDPSELAVLACDTAGDALSPEEWETLLGVLAPADPACRATE